MVLLLLEEQASAAAAAAHVDRGDAAAEDLGVVQPTELAEALDGVAGVQGEVQRGVVLVKDEVKGSEVHGES